MIEKLRSQLKPSRFEHSLGVADTAVRLAEHYGADVSKARLAGLLHDCAKNMTPGESREYCEKNNITLKPICWAEPGLIHAPLAAYMVQTDYGVSDNDIIEAIRYHTTGHADMKLLTKIIYLADTIEPSRTHAGVEQLRITAFEDIDEALLRAIDATARHIINKGGILDTDTISARNYLIMQKRETKKL